MTDDAHSGKLFTIFSYMGDVRIVLYLAFVTLKELVKLLKRTCSFALSGMLMLS